MSRHTPFNQSCATAPDAPLAAELGRIEANPCPQTDAERTIGPRFRSSDQPLTVTARVFGSVANAFAASLAFDDDEPPN